MSTRRWRSGLWVAFLAWVVACAGGPDAAPSVHILSPFDPLTIDLGEPLQIETRVKDDIGIGQVELRVNGVRVDVTEVPKGEKSYRTIQHWRPSEAGIYRLTVIASDTKGQSSAPDGITVVVGSLATPPAPVAPTPTPPATVDAAVCRYSATFVADVTIPDKTHLAPGTEFVKTWRLRNTGTCDWGAGFQFVFVNGERMDSPEAVDAPPTPAGETAEVSVRFRAPEKRGTYRSRWRMQTPDGKPFGDRPFVLIQVP